MAQVAGSRADCSRTGGCALLTAACQREGLRHTLSWQDGGEDACLESDAEGDADHDSMDGMFHNAADAVAAAVAVSSAALQQDDQLLLYGLYKQVASLPHRTAVHVARAGQQAKLDGSCRR